MRRKCTYYLLDGELYELEINPSEGRNSIPSHAVTVLEIVRNEKGLRLNKIDDSAIDFEKQAILMFHGMWNYDEDTTIILPESLISTISEYVDASIKKIIKRYHSFASEDMVTAALGERLYEEFEHDDVDVNIHFQSYSSIVKEPINGADLSFIFDIKDNRGRRVIKTILIQSKKVSNSNKLYKKIPRLDGQIEKMTKITDENYVFLYSEYGIRAFKSSNREERKSVSSLFGDVLRCKKGDRTKSVLASAWDSKYIMHMSIEE